MMKKITGILLAVLFSASLLTGCGSRTMSDSAANHSEFAEEEGWSSDSTSESIPENSKSDRAELPQQNRKLIRNAELSLETKNYDETHRQILQTAEQLGGYVERSSEYGNQDSGDRSADLMLRIPCDHYDEFLTAAEGSGSLVRKNENVRDVTREYVDVQSRLKSLRTQEKRLLELAEEAETMEDLLTIESHLAQVQYEIENYTVQQRTLDDQVDYSSVAVSIREVSVFSPVNVSFSSEVAEAFSGSWERFTEHFQDFIIWLIYALPVLMVLILLALIIFGLVVIISKTSQKRRERKARNKTQPPAVPKEPEQKNK